MKAIMVMFDTLRKDNLSCYGDCETITPNFERAAKKMETFDNFYVGSLPCIPARRDLQTGRYNFLHRSWGPIEPFDDCFPAILDKAGIYSHLVTDHSHYLEDGGATYHNRYSSWECFRGQEGDRWKPRIELDKVEKQHESVKKGVSLKQNFINRKYQAKEEDTSAYKTFKAGLDFIDNNQDKDDWFLQVECFNPHEPFNTPKKYLDMYEDDYTGEPFDWPSDKPVTESEEAVRHINTTYKAIVSMCDKYLGDILDSMDKYNMWEDTMLIINTDHGFLLSEHGWWGKNIQPQYNEIANIPFLVYDPRIKKANERRQALCQTIDIAPTVLEYFGCDIPDTMEGHSLYETELNDKKVRDYALFGMHGGHVNITDTHHLYMRACADTDNQPLYQYTLMPTNIRNFFQKKQLMNSTLTDEFDFTGNLPVLKVPVSSFISPYRFGNRLYDLDKDPKQLSKLDDVKIELEMISAMRKAMIDSQAPSDQFERLGLDKEYTEDDLKAERECYNNSMILNIDDVILTDKSTAQLLTIRSFLGAEDRDNFSKLVQSFCLQNDCKQIDDKNIDEVIEFFKRKFVVAGKPQMLIKLIKFAYVRD